MQNNEENYYKKKFKGKVFVIKIGGEVIIEKEKLKKLLLDVKKLYNAGIKLILVHGGGKQFDEISNIFGIKSKKIDGRRITTEKEIEIVKMIYGGSLNIEILSILKNINLSGVRVSGIDGNFIIAEKTKHKGNIDIGFVGKIKKINTKIIEVLLNNGFIPIIPSMTADEDGQILNTNADKIALGIAEKICADKLILFTNVDGVLDKNNKVISVLSGDDITKLKKQEIIKDGMMIKTNIAKQALKNGVKRVHILNGIKEKSLLFEVFKKNGVGTLIVKTEKEKEDYLQFEEEK